MSVHLFQFADFTSFKNACNRENSCSATCRRSSQKYDAKRSFCDTVDYNEAERIAIFGMREVEKMVEEISLEINSSIRPVSSSMTLEYSESGSYPDISLYLSGENECMVNYAYEERKTAKKVITITVQGAALGVIEPKMFKIRGAAICALVDALERAEYRCEVIYCASAVCSKSNNWEKEHIAVSFPLKQASEQIDVSRLVYCLCSASMYRRHIFKFRETLDAHLRYKLGFSESSGTSSTDDFVVEQLPSDLKILSKDWLEFWSIDSAKKYVNNVLSTLI